MCTRAKHTQYSKEARENKYGCGGVDTRDSRIGDYLADISSTLVTAVIYMHDSIEYVPYPIPPMYSLEYFTRRREIAIPRGKGRNQRGGGTR